MQNTNTNTKTDFGPGKYDAVCTVARGMTDAKAAIVIIFDGTYGSGFSVQAEDCMVANIPELLEKLAKDIRAVQKLNPLKSH